MSPQRMIYFCVCWITGSVKKATQGKNGNAKSIEKIFKRFDRFARARVCVCVHSLLGVSAELSKFTLSHITLKRNQLEGRQRQLKQECVHLHRKIEHLKKEKKETI